MPLSLPRLFSLVALLSACAQAPILPTTDATDGGSTSFPRLLPLSQIQSDIPNPKVTPASVTELDARLARLRARAIGLNRPVVDTATRARMQGAVSRAALR